MVYRSEDVSGQEGNALRDLYDMYIGKELATHWKYMLERV